MAQMLISLSELPRTPALLIRISKEWRPGLSQDQLYERVRRYWRIRPEHRATPPVLAYGIGDGAIQAVFRILSWETYDMAREAKATDRADQQPHRAGRRVGFIGHWSDEHAHLVGARLIDPPKSQNPVSYLNC